MTSNHRRQLALHATRAVALGGALTMVGGCASRSAAEPEAASGDSELRTQRPILVVDSAGSGTTAPNTGDEAPTPESPVVGDVVRAEGNLVPDALPDDLRAATPVPLPTSQPSALPTSQPSAAELAAGGDGSGDAEVACSKENDGVCPDACDRNTDADCCSQVDHGQAPCFFDPNGGCVCAVFGPFAPPSFA